MNFLQALLEKLHKESAPEQDFGMQVTPTPARVDFSDQGQEINPSPVRRDFSDQGQEINPSPVRRDFSDGGLDITASANHNGTSSPKTFDQHLAEVNMSPGPLASAIRDQRSQISSGNPLTEGIKNSKATRELSSVTPVTEEPKQDLTIDSPSFVAPKYNSLSQLINAQDAQRDTQLVNNLARIGQGVNEALNRTKFDRTALDTIDKQASQPVEAYQAGEKAKKSDFDILKDMYNASDLQQQSDPNSQISKAAKQIYEKMGFKFGPNVSMRDLEENKGLGKLIGLKIKADEHSAAAKEKEKSREAASLDRDVRSMLSGAKGDRTLNDNIVRANRLHNALQNLTVGGKISYQDLMDLQNIVIMNSGVTGQGTGHERIERLASSLGLTLDKYKQFIQGKVEDIGANNDILNRFQEIARREINGFNKIARNRITSRLSGFESKLKDHPEIGANVDNYRNNALAELPPDAATELNGRNPKSVYSSNYKSNLTNQDHSEAVQWAQANPDDPRAQKILKINGIK